MFSSFPSFLKKKKKKYLIVHHWNIDIQLIFVYLSCIVFTCYATLFILEDSIEFPTSTTVLHEDSFASSFLI